MPSSVFPVLLRPPLTTPEMVPLFFLLVSSNIPLALRPRNDILKKRRVTAKEEIKRNSIYESQSALHRFSFTLRHNMLNQCETISSISFADLARTAKSHKKIMAPRGLSTHWFSSPFTAFIVTVRQAIRAIIRRRHGEARDRSAGAEHPA